MGVKLKLTGYILVALIAIMTYFHLECLNERNARSSMFDQFNPEVTDCHNVPLPFSDQGSTRKAHLGSTWLFKQAMPCALNKLHDFVFGQDFLVDVASLKNITIFDARKHNNSQGDFHKTGFTLVKIDEPITKDWRTPYLNYNSKIGAYTPDESADIAHYFKQVNPHLKKLYPTVKRILWTTNIIRGGSKFMDQPTAPAPHLDYHQNDEDRIQFHKKYPIFESNLMDPSSVIDFSLSEPGILMGLQDTEESKLGVLLGVWKPLYPSSICDKPLAVMDASTFEPKFQNKNELLLSMIFFWFNNLGGGIAYSPKQKWYYYPFQNDREVLIFHQYSKGKFFANPHTSFFNKNCPKDTESRVSVEARVALFF